ERTVRPYAPDTRAGAARTDDEPAVTAEGSAAEGVVATEFAKLRRSGIPDPGSPVVARRDHSVAGGVVGGADDGVGVAEERPEQPSGGGIEDPRRAVPARGHDRLAVRAEGSARHEAGVPRQDRHQL